MKRVRKKFRIGRILAAMFLIATVFIAIILLVKPVSFGKPFEITEIQRERVYAMLENPPAIEKVENASINQEEYEKKKAEAIQRINKFRENQEYNIYDSKDGKKVCYLTFDDGPSTKSTGKILDILDKENVKATFFMLGNNVETYPEIAKEVYKRGHKIGNHTYSHDYKYLYSDVNNLIADVKKCDEVLKSVLGETYKNNIMRFPGGCFGEKKRAMRKTVFEKIGFINYNWNSLNGDAEGKIFTKEHLINRFKATKGSHDKLIVLMHDTNAKYTTPEALPEIIKILKSEGYTFSTLPD